MRYVSRFLLLVWASWWTLFILSLVVFQPYAAPPIPPRTPEDLILLVILALIVLALWDSVAISWRWEGVGGIVLLVEGLVAFGTITVISAGDLVLIALGTLTIALPPVVAGFLLLASWEASRRSGPRQNSA